MRWVRKIALALLAVFIMIQFVQPTRNLNADTLSTDLAKTYPIPENLHVILKVSCYDCHSNSTSYPWYSRIQPFGWILAKHIREGKSELNFSEFGSYSLRRQRSKLKGIGNSVRDGSMPLRSYSLFHKGARLSKPDKELLIKWAEQLADSLIKKQPGEL
jgi:hypothetical protein